MVKLLKEIKLSFLEHHCSTCSDPPVSWASYTHNIIDSKTTKTKTKKIQATDSKVKYEGKLRTTLYWYDI